MTDEETDESNAKSAPGAERRARPRDDRTVADWESIALLRVASRVQSLTAPEAAAPPDPAPPGFGWEEDILRKLSERLKDRGSA